MHIGAPPFNFVEWCMYRAYRRTVFVKRLFAVSCNRAAEACRLIAGTVLAVQWCSSALEVWRLIAGTVLSSAVLQLCTKKAAEVCKLIAGIVLSSAVVYPKNGCRTSIFGGS